jgi:RimJ/RimL family protein N-acetyltransferase
VLAHNSTAIKLYQRCGFHIEGRRREALLVNGRFVDELYAGLLLDQDRPPDGP